MKKKSGTVNVSICIAMIFMFISCFNKHGQVNNGNQGKNRGGNGSNQGHTYIRYNQVGYLKSDQKIAIVGSNKDLEGKPFYIVSASNPDNIVYTGKISSDRGFKNTPFNHNMVLDFSDFNSTGKYRIKLKDDSLSGSFAIGVSKGYQNALKLILEFYRSQRCGDNDPLLHKACHLDDRKAAINAAGGWHDAGDYIKFMITATYTTVELLTAADYAQTYHFENALADVTYKNGVPGVIAEARIGLQWILRMTTDYRKGNYYHQVGSEEAHNYWRMPADDHFEAGNGHRKVYKGWGGNLLGRSAAALAIAYRVFQKYDKKFAAKCLKRAKGLFAQRSNYEFAETSTPSDFYDETTWRDDMVLGAAELYKSTKEKKYFNYAKNNLKRLTHSGIGWGDTAYLAFAACYKAGINPQYDENKMRTALEDKEQKMKNDAYYLSSGYTWGTTALFTSDAQKAIMYYYLTSDGSFLNIATDERDYLLGRNNWGISFVVGVGHNYPLHIQSQINDLSGSLQKGAVVGGPTKKQTFRNQFPDINLQDSVFTFFGEKKVNKHKYSKFQSKVVYHDDIRDYITNEAADDYAAPSVFIFLYNIANAH